MATQPDSPFPSVDRIARFAVVDSLCETYGRSAVIDAIRAVLDEHRTHIVIRATCRQLIMNCRVRSPNV